MTDKANIFMLAGWAGLGGIAVTLVGNIPAVIDELQIAGASLAVLACWVMLFTRNADEYTRGLWTSAASLAFATLLVLFIALPFLEGVYDGFNAAHEGDGAPPPSQDIPSLVSITAAIGAFYIGLFWTRFRGA